MLKIFLCFFRNVDKVDDIMDKIRDTMDDAEVISDAISQPLGMDLVDEGALEDELEALENEMLEESNLVDIPKNQLPTTKETISNSNQRVPIGTGGGGNSKLSEKDDELARLEAELGL